MNIVPKLARSISLFLSLSACALPNSDQEVNSVMFNTKADDDGAPPIAAGPGAGPQFLAQPVSVTDKRRADWAGASLGISRGEWTRIGTFEKAAADAKPMSVAIAKGAVSAPRVEDAFVVGYPDTGEMYQVKMSPADSEALAKLLTASGLSRPTRSDVGADAEAPFVEKNWSNASDNRIPRGINENGANSWPFQTIAQATQNSNSDATTGHCTATFVGSGTPHIMTSAHCFWSSSGTYFDPDYIPRRDNCTRPNGTTISGCDITPFGRFDGGVWMMSQYFVNNCVPPKSYTQECAAEDIAVQSVGAESGAVFPGAIGFGAYTTTQLNTFSKYERGYPNCGGTGDPTSNCRTATLYGDTNLCVLGSGTSTVSGWDRLVRNSCDDSPGMSGSPFYLYDGAGVYAFGVSSADVIGITCYNTSCTGNNNNATPNWITRITPTFHSWMLDFMNL
jgi:V8-like Glu-specific endopeptidase